MRNRFLLTLMALALIAAACGGDDGETSVEEPESDPSAESDEPPEEEAPEPDDPEPEEPEPEPEEPEAPETLPASFRGVTETTIKVGVAVPDFDALQAAGVSNYQGSAEVAFGAFFDKVNEEGGIFGRMIDPVYVVFDFVAPETQDLACSQFAEDHDVFIVLYGLLGDSNLCLTNLQDTMVMTRSFQTSVLRDQAEVLWLQLNAIDDDRTRVMGRVLAESGRLDGKTVAILVSEAQSGSGEGAALNETLGEFGIDAEVSIGTAPGGDSIARDADLALIAEGFRVDGVDFVFDLFGGGDTAGSFSRAGFTPQFAFKALGASIDGTPERSLLDGALSVSEINEQAIFADADFQTNCMEVVRAANPDLVDEMAILPTGDQQAAGEPNWINPVMISCDQTRLLDALGEIAGADLTNDSFRGALDDLGPFDLYGYGQASFDSESKWDGLDEFYIQQYDAATDTIEVLEAVVVER
jgi:hypothetical protein